MMPEQPNQSEELLKRYAQERRAQGGDFALHPATRQLLHGEVKRLHGTAGRTGGRGWLAALGSMRGRLALGSTVVAAIVLLFTFWNRPPETQLAEFNAPIAQSFLSDSDAIAPVGAKQKVETLTVADQFVTPEKLARENTFKLELVSKAEGGAAYWDVQKFARADRSLNEQTDLYFAYRSPSQTNAAGNGAWFGNNLRMDDNSDFLALSRLDGGVAVSSGGISSTQPVTYFNDLALDDFSATGRRSVALGFGGFSGSAEAKAQTLNDSTATKLGAVNEKLLAENSTLPAQDLAGVAVMPTGRADGELERRRGYAVSAPAPAPTSLAPISTARSEVATEQRGMSSTPAAKPDAPVATRAAPIMLAAAPDASVSRFLHSTGPLATNRTVQSPAAALFGSQVGAAPPPVLVNFSIEQSGNTVRVIDADGSVYDGAVETPPDAVTASAFDAEGLKETDRRSDPVARGALAAQRQRTLRHRELSFRAAGSNTTLRQVVIINGRLSETESLGEISGALVAGAGPTTKALPTVPAGGAKRERLKDIQDSRSETTPGTNLFSGRYGFTTNPVSTIEGTVRIGSTNQQWFRAVRQK